ncbi:MAG: leucine-rich repeat protein [Ruminococcus sp.]|nr:leucine-rich repeat protein [Ruminococcus sp.]
MLNHKKTLAMLTSLLLCASAVVPSVSFADDEISSVTDDAEVTVEGSETDTEDASELTVSGDYSYSVTSDGNIRIENCTSTETDLVVPDTIDGKKVAELGAKAFGNDPDNNIYETITIPASVDYISEENPFFYCLKLREIIVDKGNAEYTSADGILYSKDMTRMLCYPPSKEGDSLTIDSKVTEIGTAAVFMTGLKKIEFPSGLETISRHAFSTNEKLTAVDLSSTKVTSIGAFAFAGCSALSDVKLPDTLQNIEGGAFSNCEKLTEIELPMGLLSVGQSAFMNTGLTYIIVPSSVQEIGYAAFGYRLSQGGVETDDPTFLIVGEAGSAAHKYSTDSDTDYDYKNEFQFMTPENYAETKELEGLDSKTEGSFTYAIVDGNAVILNCSSADNELTVPAEFEGHKLTTLYTASFSSCQSEHIIIPEGVTEIRKGAFYGCQQAESIVLPQSVKTVGEAAFAGCPLLTTVDLGGVETIEKDLFDESPMIRSLTISGNFKNVSEDEPFIEYTSLQEINVSDSGDGNFSSIDGVLFSKDHSILFVYPASKEGTFYKVPDEVKTIANSAFYNNQHLETIDLSNVEDIAEYAFEQSQSLKKVIMSKELTTLGPDAFYNCMNLKSLRFYDKLENLGAYAFGFYYHEDTDSAESESEEEAAAASTDKAIEDFVVYAPKDSIAYKYAKDYGIKVKTGTMELFGANVSVPFLIVLCLLGVGLIIALILAVTSKSRKAKKEAKELEKLKANAAEKLKAKKKPEDGEAEEGENEDK